MNTTSLNFGSAPTTKSKAVGLSFISSPEMRPDVSIAALETFRFAKENTAALRSYSAFTELQGLTVNLKVVYAGTTLLSQTTSLGATTLEDALSTIDVNNTAINFSILNSPISTKGIQVTRAGSWGLGITPGVVFRSYTIPAYEQTDVWFQQGVLATKLPVGAQCILIYSVPEAFYGTTVSSTNNSFPGTAPKYRTVKEKVTTGGPNRIRFEGEISTLTKIIVNDVVKFSGTYVNEDNATIKEVNNALKYIDVNFTVAPDDVVYIEYTTYAQSYTYLGYRNGYNGGYFAFDANPEYGHLIADERYNKLRASSDALLDQVTIYAIPSAVAVLEVLPPSTNGYPTALITFYSAYDFGESHFIRHAVGAQLEDIVPRLSDGPTNTYGFAVFGRNYYDESGVPKRDIYSLTHPSMLPLARVLLKAPQSVKGVKIVDIRLRGGGIPETADFNLLALEPSAINTMKGFYDLGTWDGKAIQEGGVVTINIDTSVLDNYTTQEVEEIVRQRIHPGISYEIVYTTVT